MLWIACYCREPDEEIAPPHPGDPLREEFLAPCKLTPAHGQRLVVCPGSAIERIVREEIGITADGGLRLAKVFGNSVAFWLNRHTSYDIETARRKIDKGLEKIEPLKAA